MANRTPLGPRHIVRGAASRRLADEADKKAGRFPQTFNRLSPKAQENILNSPETKERLSKKQILKRLSDLAMERFRTKQTSGPGYYHGRRRHLQGNPDERVYSAYEVDPETGQRGVYMTSREKVGFEAARKAGYRGQNILPKSEKKRRKEKYGSLKIPQSSNSFKAFSRQFKEAYYFVLEYLLSEGYADTYEDADGIFQVMSEEWFADILEI